LSVIIGFTELAMDEVDPAGPLRANLDQVLTAAQRAADITRQLLAFARKQPIAPQVLDLNGIVESMLKMLRRLISEEIDLTWAPGTELWPVKLDPSQVDQILANLCVNARDAIEEQGKITIETGNATFDDAYCADHSGFIPGEFVLLAVSDNGCGIGKDILDNMFEPFFTTKDADKGTGLGLSTVYGIVKQNKGFINVYSEPGEGTTIKLYLPRHQGEAVAALGPDPEGLPQGRGETILLVEDDLPIIKLAKKTLQGLGYKVLAARTPFEAMALAEQHPGGIDLLLTDVIMPQMNGRDLALRLQTLFPKLKCVFMSGYTANVIAHHGVLDQGVHFIQKPFYKKDMAKMVRKALDEKAK
ncbi:MAG: response regulator, partial [Proteobacteria bacterium]|nr:response regulator [Pseudomonadota bacterium]